MRFYKLAGSEQYVAWDTLHNVAGYSEQATNEITWKSVENWGTSAGTGYELPVEQFSDSELFMYDVLGWHDLDWFALERGVYPSTASDMVLTHPVYGSSPVAFMVFDDGTYYLIQKDISQGWMTEEEYTERGWQLPGYIVLNSETGAILGAAKGHELETVPIPACTIASLGMECVPIPAWVLESPEMVVYVPTVVELPEVGSYNTLYGTSDVQTITIASGETHDLYGFQEDKVSFDSSNIYAVDKWQKGDAWSRDNIETIQIVNNSGYFALKNASPGSLTNFVCVRFCYCSSNQATVVTVYNTSNNAYNAFKFTTNSTDYYYVLDGTQTDWTDDLSSIGYHTAQPQPDYLDIFFYYNSGTSVTFGANDYWGSRIIDNEDKLTLESFGVTIDSYQAQDSGYMVARSNLNNFTFTPIGLYSGLRTGDLNADMSNFYCGTHESNQGSLYYGVCIMNYAAYNTNTLTWKCRITRINGGN